MTPLSPIENLFAVEVPLDAKDFELIPMPGRVVLKWVDEGRAGTTYLLAGSYEILFTTINCSESDAATAGFPSKGKLLEILRANGLSENKNYLLIKKTPQQ